MSQSIDMVAFSTPQAYFSYHLLVISRMSQSNGMVVFFNSTSVFFISTSWKLTHVTIDRHGGIIDSASVFFISHSSDLTHCTIGGHGCIFDSARPFFISPCSDLTHVTIDGHGCIFKAPICYFGSHGFVFQLLFSHRKIVASIPLTTVCRPRRGSNN